MRIIVFEKIDGFDILTGFRSSEIDPKETEKVLKKIMPGKKEFQHFTDLVNEMNSYTHQAMQAFRNAKTAKTKPERKKFEEEYHGRQQQIKDLEPTIKEAFSKYTDLHKKMIKEHGVPFPAKVNEIIVTDERAKALEKALEKIQGKDLILDVEGNEIPHYKGQVFYVKQNKVWEKIEIKKLGEEPPQSAVSELTGQDLIDFEEEQEARRLASLSPEAKLQEKQQKIAQVEALMQDYYVKLLIVGEKTQTAAAKEAKDLLAEKKAEIEALYS